MRLRHRIRPVPWALAVVIGAASVGYLLRALPAGVPTEERPGVWDVTVAVATEPRFLVIVCLTAALTASVLRREAVLPELMRLGTWRAYLAREAAVALRSILPSAIAVVLVCVVGGVLAGVPWRSSPAAGTAAAQFVAVGIAPPLVVLLQLLHVAIALTVLHVGLTAIRIVTGSIVPVIATVLLLFSWSSVSVLALVTTITPTDEGAPLVATQLAGGIAAGLNTITYLDLPIAVEAGPHIPVIGLGLITALAFGTATALDRRVRRARRPAQPAALQLTRP